MNPIEQAIDERDAHLRRILEWHFSEETGCPFWLRWKAESGIDPRQFEGFDQMVAEMPPFEDKWLKEVSADDWKPKGFVGCRQWSMWQTGGTTGIPSERWGRIGDQPGESDYADDYHEFSAFLGKMVQPSERPFLYAGPEGRRRLARGCEIIANNVCNGFMPVGMDVVWLKDPANTCAAANAERYAQRAIIDIEKHRPEGIFCPPILIQKMAEQPGFDWKKTSVKYIFAGGTAMNPATVQYIMELLGDGIIFIPTYGNALVGLATMRPISTPANPITGQEDFYITYQPLQPRTLLRVTKREDPTVTVADGESGFVHITTVTKEWFMPEKRERDYADWIPPTDEYPWHGVGNVRPDPEAPKKAGGGGVY